MSHEENDLTPADRELEAALKSLAPTRPSGIDPLTAAFAAGGRAARREVRFWQSAAAAVLMIAIGGWLISLGRDANVSPPTIASAPPPSPLIVATAPAPSWSSPGRHSVVTLQQTVHAKGVDGLPTTELPAVRNLRLADLF
jgi:hypothetical protein